MELDLTDVEGYNFVTLKMDV
jgi:hypothetical protein